MLQPTVRRPCSHLASALREEVAHEETVQAEMLPWQQVADSLVGLSVQSHVEGNSLIFLGGKGPRNEDILVRFDCEDKFHPDDVAEDDDGDHGVWFEVQVTRSGDADDSLCFKCLAYDGALMVEDVKVVVGDGLDDDDVHPYQGPKFEDLDERVQEGVREYLHSRHITDAFCEQLVELAMVKEQLEYQDFLSRFVKIVE